MRCVDDIRDITGMSLGNPGTAVKDRDNGRNTITTSNWNRPRTHSQNSVVESIQRELLAVELAARLAAEKVEQLAVFQ